MEKFVPLPDGCTAAASALKSWVGLAPNIDRHTELNTTILGSWVMGLMLGFPRVVSEFRKIQNCAARTLGPCCCKW